jgi:hypothetical protein
MKKRTGKLASSWPTKKNYWHTAGAVLAAHSPPARPEMPALPVTLAVPAMRATPAVPGVSPAIRATPAIPAVPGAPTIRAPWTLPSLPSQASAMAVARRPTAFPGQGLARRRGRGRIV